MHLESSLKNAYPKLFAAPFYCSVSSCQIPEAWYPLLKHLCAFLHTLSNKPLRAHFSEQYQENFKKDPDFFKKFQSHTFAPPQIEIEDISEESGSLNISYQTHFQELPEDVWQHIDLKSFQDALNRYTYTLEAVILFAEYQASQTPTQTPLEKPTHLIA